MQTAVANARAKTKYVSTQREQVCYVLAVFTCPLIVTTTVVLVFFVPHMKLVYLAFSILFDDDPNK